MEKSREYAEEEFRKAFRACFKGIKRKGGFCLADIDHFFPLDYKELWRRRSWNIQKEENMLMYQRQVKDIYEKMKVEKESEEQLVKPMNEEKESK